MLTLKPWKPNNIAIYSNDNRRYVGVNECWSGIHVKYKDIGSFTLYCQHFCNFEVKEDYRGKGYARKLFRQAQRLGRFYGLKYLVFTSKPKLIGMYESFGAVVIETHPYTIHYRIELKETP